MPKTTDFYELLHIRADAPPALIKASYRTLMQKLKMHPDLGGDLEVASQINVAYATLSDPAQRAQYDLSRVAGKAARPEDSPAYEDTTTSQSPETHRIMWRKGDSQQWLDCQFCKLPHGLGNQPPNAALCVRCESPLARADSRSLLPGERRALERLDLERQISFRSGLERQLQQAHTTDLSLTGLKFVANADLIPNQLIQISSLFCLALGRVAHVTTTVEVSKGLPTCQFGVEFLTLCFPTTKGSLVSTRA